MNPRLSTPVSRPKITAIVTSFNEEKNIGECLQSLAWCDDIMLVDSFSSDRTVELAKLIPRVRVVQRHYFGAAAQKNWAIDQIKEGWVLILDADERVSPELRWEIESLLAGPPKSNAYTLHRQVYFMHRKIRYSGWQHDRVARLFLAGQAHYENKRVHAKLLTNGEAPRLRNSLIHFMADDFHEYARRILKYSYWGGAQLWRDGKRANFMQILPRSLWRFIRTFFLQLGILDGMHGMVFCLLQAYGTYMKWAMVWGWTQQQKAGQEPVLPEFEEAPNLRPLVFPSQIRSSL